MAVLERRYETWNGGPTPAWSRFLVVPRYAYREIFRSRAFVGFFVVCLVLPLIGAVYIYLHHNLKALEALDIPVQSLLPIDERAFLAFLNVQAMMFGFVLTLIVAPALISSDLRNNALPLYLARPFSRAEYVLGKLSILAILLSAITWVPGLLLFALQAALAEPGWLAAHGRIAWAIFVGSWVWILVLSLLGLALSAWVKWKPLASGLLIGVFMVGAAFGTAINELLGTRWGYLLNLSSLIHTVWGQLFAEPRPWVPVWSAWLTLAGFVGLSLLLLAHKVRAYEVTR